MNTDLIDETVDVFVRSILRLEALVRFITEQLEKDMKAEGIRCRVSGRVKNRESLREKLRKNAQNPKEKTVSINLWKSLKRLLTWQPCVS